MKNIFSHIFYMVNMYDLLTYRLVILTILEDATVGILVVVEGVPIPVVQQYVQHSCPPVIDTSDNYTYI